MNDRLSELLASVRLEGFVRRRLEMSAPWGLRIPPSADVRFCIVLSGAAHLTVSGASAPVMLGAGDSVLIPGGQSHSLRDAPASLITLPFGEMHEGAEGCQQEQRVHRAGGGGAATEIVIGAYHLDKVTARPLLRLLPDVMKLEGEDGQLPSWTRQLAQLSFTELAQPNPGADGILRHIATLLFVSTIRDFLLRRHAVGLPSHLVGASPITNAIAAVHARPSEPWTVSRMARLVGMSRSAFAATFSETMGAPPMRYVLDVRMAHAAALLRERVVSLGDVAHAAGYSTTIAFLRAFKRRFGVTPGAYKERARSQPQGANLAA
jgi:AraC-like DNA-binding protein